ncbi:MAG: gliding motility-associated C-terminal domain-containing protein, partial [Bacteroidota bacterium]
IGEYPGTWYYDTDNCPGNCLLEGELNDVWYTFTVQTSGTVSFALSPINTADDYDWAVYNLTNNTCADIISNPSLQVSCNFCGNPGVTGPTGGGSTNCMYGYVDNCNTYNSVLNVTAGQIYVVNVSNFSSTQSGYIITFGGTAQIVDNTGPYLQTVLYAPSCGQNTVTVRFNENVSCSTVQAGDFYITGPGGPYTVTSATSSVCSSGGTYARDYTLTITPAFTSGGSYTVGLVANSVSDICNHPTGGQTVGFTVTGVNGSATINNQVSCYGGSNGSATASASGGTTPYSYHWSYGNQTTATVTNLPAGTHYVTVTDVVGVCQDVETVVITQPTQILPNISPDPASVCEGTAISMNGNPSGGSGAYTSHSWTGTGSSYLSSTGIVNPTFSASAPNGSYTLTYTVVNSAGCSGTDNLTVTVYDAPTVSAGSGASTCGTTPYSLSGSSMGGGASSVTWSSSGTGSFSSTTTLHPTYTPSAADVTSGSVTLTITTNNPAGPCNAVSSNMVLTIYTPASVNAGPNAAICSGSTYNLSGSTMGGSASSVLWTSSGSGTFSSTTALHPTYTPSAADITAGTVTLTVTTNDPTGPCTSASDNMVLTINPLANANFSYSQGTYCSTGSDPTPTASTPGGTYSAPGQVVISSMTGTIDLSASTVGGPYTVTYTIGGACPNSSTFLVTITSGFDAEFFYSDPYCQYGTNPLPGHTTGSNGTYTVSPAGLNFISSGTGQINLATSTPGTYTVTNTIAASGGCAADNHNDQVIINPAALVNAGTDNSICQGSTFVINGSSIGGSTTTLTWTSGGTGTFDSQSLLHPVYTPSALDISNGTVTLTITSNDPDGAGPCIAATDNMILTIYSAATVNAGIDASICAGSTYTMNGSIGGGAGDINWTSSGTGTFNNPSLTNAVYTPSAADIAAGTVTLTATTNDPVGPCGSATDNMVLTIFPAPVVSAGSDATICQGQTYALGGSFGGGAGSITWTTSGNGTFSNANNVSAVYTPGSSDISAGTVTLTITTNNPAGPCNAVNDVMVLTINPAATVNAGADATICSGNTYTLAGTMGGSASSITWTSSGTGTFSSASSTTAVYTPSAADIAAGTVTLTITTNDPDGGGPCSQITDNMILTINQAPVIAAGTDATICEGDDYTLAGTTGGSTSSLTWTTSGDGTFSNPAQAGAVYTPGTGDITAGTVTLTITSNDPDGAGPCVAVNDNMVLTINPTPKIDSVAVGLVTSCVPPYDGSITVYASGGVAPLQYSLDGGANYYPVNSANTLPVGSYTIAVISNVGGCEIILDTAVVVESTTGPAIDSIVVTNALCYGSNTGTIQIYATGANLYSIDNGANYYTDSTFYNNLGAGNYSIMIQDIGNCLDIDNVTISQPSMLTISVADSVSILCNADTLGSITVDPDGGTLPYSYAWDVPWGINDSVVDGLAGGVDYHVTVTDGNGCTEDLTFMLYKPPKINTAISRFDVNCYGGNDGWAYVTATGGTGSLSYEWSNTVMNDTVYNLSAGVQYLITVTDVNNCIAVDTVIVDQPDSILIASNVSDATCGGSDGVAFVNITGGTTPYFYEWTNSLGSVISVTDTANYLSYGDYWMVITDGNSCQDSVQIHIDNQGGGSLTIDSTVDILCNGDGTGEIVVTLTNGTPDFTFIWSTNDTTITTSMTDTLSGLSGGTYSVTVTDLNGCIADTIVTITEPPAMTVTDVIIPVSCFGDTDGEINLTAGGGVSPYTYYWSTGDTLTSGLYSNLAAGGYEVTVVDGNGCKFIIIEMTVSQPSVLALTATGFEPVCYNDTTGWVTSSATGGTPPLNYVWFHTGWTSSVNDSTVQNLGSGTYYVTVTDSRNCSETDYVTLYDPSEMQVSLSDTVENYQGTITVTVIGGTLPIIYSWSNGATENTITGLPSGTYAVTVTDANNCSFTDSVEVIIPLIIPSLFTPNVDGHNDNWAITNIEVYEDLSIEVYNRWGDLVYTFSGSGQEYSDEPWDGTYNGAEMPMGGYVYIIDLKDGNEPYNGVVSIKR